MSNSKVNIFHPVVALTMALTGCMMLPGCHADSLPAYSEFVDIDPELWSPGVPAELAPWPRDSALRISPFRLDLAVRYTLSAPDTLKMAVSMIALDIEERTDTVSLQLIAPDNKPSGRGSYGFYTAEMSVMSGDTLPAGLRVSAEPLYPVRGIVSAGLILSSGR